METKRISVQVLHSVMDSIYDLVLLKYQISNLGFFSIVAAINSCQILFTLDFMLHPLYNNKIALHTVCLKFHYMKKEIVTLAMITQTQVRIMKVSL